MGSSVMFDSSNPRMLQRNIEETPCWLDVNMHEGFFLSPVGRDCLEA